MYTLVTGGGGFIGSNLVHALLEDGQRVLNIDCMSYNSHLPDIPESEYYTFKRVDLKTDDILSLLVTYNVSHIYHLAAQTHVDRSFENSIEFSKDNVVGTHKLLEAVKEYGRVTKFLHMSTDEVYGQVFEHVSENALMNPTNPYAATKCGAEMLVRSYGHSYGLNYVIARGNNVYGPRQYPDKLIPIFLRNMFEHKDCHVHGDGSAQRHFIHVSDVCSALKTIMHAGVSSDVYNIASPDEFTVNEIFDILREKTQSTSNKVHVDDRPFNDQRYHINCDKLLALGWAPTMAWNDGIEQTIAWYRAFGDTFWKRTPTWLMYGHGGWIGQKYRAFADNHVRIIPGTARADDVDAIVAEMDRVQPDHVVCIIGRTHGPGCGTIDWLEQPGHLRHNVRDNLFGPFVLAMECKKRNIKMTYMGTGCIFKYDAEKRLFTENDRPNFFGSSYSIVKGFTDQMMKFFTDTVLNCRIRMPISSDKSPRNFISKITTYEYICSIPNSMTVLEEILPLMVDMALQNVTGTFNMTNPGVISHNEILEMYRDIVDDTFTWKNFSQEEQLRILAADRSNNELDASKLQQLYPHIRPIHQAVEDTLRSMTL